MSLPQPLVICLIAINGIGFSIYGLDKAFSKQKDHPRIPERVLLWTARIGGGVGCWLGMLLLEKTEQTQPCRYLCKKAMRNDKGLCQTRTTIWERSSKY